MFRVALSNHIYSFTFRDTNLDTLSPCAPKHVMWQRVFRGVVQSTELDIVNGSFCNLCALTVGLALHILATQC